MQVNQITARMTTNVLPLALAQALAPSESARPVPGASRYWVTNHGRVFSVVNGLRLLRAYRNARGYLHVEVWRDADRDPTLPARWQPYAHALVALAFRGARPARPGVAYEIDHVDGDKANNRLSNLRYVTRSENLQLAIAAGLHSTAKLSAVSVWTLRCRAYVDGDDVVVRQAVEEHGVKPPAVRDALAGRSWKTVPDPASRPTASELARALMLTTDEARPLLRLSPYSESYNPGGEPVAARVLPLRPPTDRRAA